MFVIALGLGAQLGAQGSAPAQRTAAANAGGSGAAASGPIVLSGRVLSGLTPLPGVSVSAISSDHYRYLTSSDAAGRFELRVPTPGRYTISASFAAFADLRQTITVAAAGPHEMLLQMTLQSRARAAGAPRPGVGAAGGGELAAGMGALALSGEANAGGLTTLEEGGSNGTGAALPAASGGLPAASGGGGVADTSTETVAVAGRMGQTASDALRPGGFGRFRGGPGGFGPGGFRGGPPGGFRGGPPGGGRMIFIARRRGGFNFNAPHGSIYYSLADGAFDARPYALTGAPQAKPSFLQQRYGIAVGSPLVIPKLVNSPKTFVFLNITGNHSATPFTAFSTVPTLAERAGNFSGATTQAGQPITLYDAATGSPYPNDSLPAISPQATALLPYIPEPNLPGDFQNFYFAGNQKTNTDQVNVRVMHNFGAPPQFGRGRPFGGGGTRSLLAIAVRYQGGNNNQLDALPSIAGTTRTRGMDVNASYIYGAGKMTNILRVDFNRNRIDTQNLYAFAKDIAAAAGIGGVSTAPFDWGLPNLSFSDFASLNDITPTLDRNQTTTFSDFVIWNRGKQTWRMGGDFRRIEVNPETDPNARGGFVFTGLYTSLLANGAPTAGTGSDFADFLLGEAQQASINYGAGADYFRGDSWDLFAQNNWRARNNLSLNLGLRYEFVSPMTELYNRMANLDVAPGFSAVAPVLAGSPGPYTGLAGLSLIHPDRLGFEPRVGFAWAPRQNTVLRGGYGINLNTGAYSSLATQLAAQPPFATSATNLGTPASPLSLADAFTPSASGQISNSFAVNPFYRMGYVQMWNLDLQHQFGPTLLLNLDYTGSKGTDLDQTLAPNRGPNGLLLPNVDAFLWQTSGGDSILHSGSVILQKRMAGGWSVGGTYTWSKSIDDASAIGGGATAVAQNPLDLAAERGLSAFNVGQSLSGDVVYDLPWGPDRPWLSGDSWAGRILGSWELSGDYTLATGTPLTPRVLGNVADVARGTNGTLRPNETGQAIALAAPTMAAFFNTGAFAAPPSGAYGDAGRDIIIGPGQISFSSALSKSVDLGEFRSLELRVEANNVFNHPQWAGVDTTLNSPTFGRVTSVGSMRTLQLLARYRF